LESVYFIIGTAELLCTSLYVELCDSAKCPTIVHWEIYLFLSLFFILLVFVQNSSVLS